MMRGNGAAYDVRPGRRGPVLAALLLVLLPASLAWAGAPLNLPVLNQYDEASVAVAAAASPSVVLVQVERTERRPGLPGFPERTRRSTAQGSGVIIDAAGLVLTNRHLVENATAATVYLPGGEQYQASVVGSDAVRDLAVLRISPTRPLAVAVLGDSDRQRPGTWVMAIGYPFGAELDVAHAYEPSVAVGVISAIGREVESDVRGQSFRGLLQTDAAINPGNSGGPLVNSHGEVIGINQAIYTPGLVGANVGVGFAIPVNARTKQIIRTIMAGGTVVRGYLGASLAELTATLRQRYGVETGAAVAQVGPRGPAGRAGLRAGDVITAYGAERITTPGQLVDLVQGTAPNTAVQVQLVRDKRPMTLTITVGRLP